MEKAIKKVKANFFIPHILYVLLGGLIVRLLLSSFGTLRLDQGTFIAWSINLAQNGFANFYSGWSDYLPGYLYVLWFLGKLRANFPIPEVLLYKLPAIISDLLTGYLIFSIVRKVRSEKWGLIASSAYLFNPAILANSSLWGQVDSLTALTSILSIWLVNVNPYLSAVFLSVGVLIKPQVAFILPVLFFLFLKNKWKHSKVFFYGLVSLTTFVLGFIPFFVGKNLPKFILERVGVSLNQYPYISVNAFNFWGFFGFWKPDTFQFQYIGYFIALVIFIFICVKKWREKNVEFILTGIIFASSFLFFTRMHERHLLPVFAPLIISSALEPLFLIPYLGFSLLYILNLYYSYNWITYDFKNVFPDIVIKLIILLGSFSFWIFIWSAVDKKRVEEIKQSILQFFNKGRRKILKEPFNQVSLKPHVSKIIIISILLFSFFTRIFDLGKPPEMYFDEIYHAFTAKLVLHGDPKAWEWWNPHPEGFAYEWTHPPLSKLMMAFGMKIFGENSFGWRFPQALFGTLSVFLIYLLAKKVFKDELIAIFSALIFSFDGLSLVLSRMGMNDIYVMFFMLSSIYFFLKEKDFLSAISFGFALSSKWSAIWTIPILFILWLRRKKKFSLSILWFSFLPITIYLASYTPMFLTGHDLGTWWGMQKQMWWYHTGLKATHPYTSPWWSWPLMERPVYLYTSDEMGGMVSRIYAIGNPLTFWFGLISILICLTYAYFEKNRKLGLIVFSYLIFFVPWAASPRIMFLYHYLPSIPFLAIATGYILRRNLKIAFWVLAIDLLLFVYFYPHWAGLNIPLWLDKSYYWLASWR